ncbi:MAG TPA: imidazolonepropionase [Acidimicrobiales bacterium]|nr:imidazolonepropionase [Acidimicrobiales bacterium]
MTSVAVDNIALLVTGDPEAGSGPLGVAARATLVMEEGFVVAAGQGGADADARIDAGGRCVMPGFVDSHTHLVFAGDRAAEFAARMAGQPYESGGIRVTTAATRAAGDDELRRLAAARRLEARRGGTTTIEIKSGYALTTAGEARLLRLASELTTDTTFLGAHVVPDAFAGRPDDYVEEVVSSMLPACAPLARFVDAFCEDGAFDAEQCRAVLTAGAERGLVPKLHANQLRPGPGVQLAVELGAASADHCTHLTDADIDALATSDTVATLLPAADFSTRQPYPPARRLLDAGAAIALASNCNPGSSNTTSMAFVIALAVREMGMTVEEAVRAATFGGAVALRRTDVGRLVPGARADLVVLDAPSYTHLAYRPGVPLVAGVIEAGVVTYRDGVLWP